MPSPKILRSLKPEELKAAQEATTVLVVTHKGYLPGSLLRMLLSRFRDDIREITGMAAEGLPRRGEHHELDELTSTELDAIAGAVTTLLEDSFKAVMTDPALVPLLDQFHAALISQKNERAELQASIAS
ncbi:MAG: hypothetical protein WAL41_11680 [Mycobacterium sp.]